MNVDSAVYNYWLNKNSDKANVNVRPVSPTPSQIPTPSQMPSQAPSQMPSQMLSQMPSPTPSQAPSQAPLIVPQNDSHVNVIQTNPNMKYNYVKCDKTVYVVKSTIYTVFHTLMAFFACYLSYKCNNGFHLTSFIVALIFPYIYIIYILSTRGICDVPKK
jgi:hypothetical protein